MPSEITVQQLLDTKENKLFCITSDATVFDALKILSEAKIGALPVIDEGRLVGMFSERDYARKVILEGKYSKDARVGEIMTAGVCHVSPDQTARQCMALMTENRFRHLPVIKDEAVVGIVSIGDIV